MPTERLYRSVLCVVDTPIHKQDAEEEGCSDRHGAENPRLDRESKI